jgi:DNA mismatch repair protein MutL
MALNRIRKLPEGTINRIAAGEVVERPASAVKELVENAIDAGATQIDVAFRGGGKSLIRISDNGSGMEADELQLAIQRHATSKLSDDALININTLGFRGEALPSIASISRMAIISRASENAHELQIEAGKTGAIAPASRARGTDIEIRDIFYATPARLKFLKSDRSEVAEALDVVRRLALANPAIGFSFATEERRWLDAPAAEAIVHRVDRIMGKDFAETAIAIYNRAEDLVIEGYAGLPTASRGNSALQFAYVNSRPVRDKLISGAIRGAYADVLPPGRFPAICLFITCPSDRVDVNVHPAKTEIRFRDAGFVRGLIVSTIKRAIASRPVTPDTSRSTATLSAFRPISNYGPGFAEAAQAIFEVQMPVAARTEVPVQTIGDYPLGTARAQIHDNYILAQTADGMILVDQHAAHERIVYERLKRERENTQIAVQPLLVPQVIDLDPQSAATIAAAHEMLKQAGLDVEPFGASAVIVRELPAALINADMSELLLAIADEPDLIDGAEPLAARMNKLLATMACHYSVRSGRTLRHEEMNALLRQMEQTPNAGECNHGRPTFIKLSLTDIERLFGRT